MTQAIKPGLDRRVAKAIYKRWVMVTERGGNFDEAFDLGLARVAIRAIACELPPIQAARLLKAAGIERKHTQARSSR